MNEFVDAIQFIFNEHESPAGGAQVGGLSNMWDLMSEHLQLSVVAMAIACALSIPLGLWLGHIGKGGFLAINASNVGRAVPSLALIAFFFAYIGVGFTNLALALVLLGDSAHPHHHLHRRPAGRPRDGRLGARHGHDRRPDRAPGRAAARAAADLRRDPHLGCQRDRDGDARDPWQG